MKNGEFFIITKSRVGTLAEKLKDPVKLSEVKSEVEKMLEIKESLLQRAGGPGVPKEIEREQAWEVEALEKIIDALKEKDLIKGILLLQEYKEYSSISEK